jgi:hypothetical protein
MSTEITEAEYSERELEPEEPEEVATLPALNGLATDLAPLLAEASTTGWQLPLDLGVKEWREKASFVGVLGEARHFYIGDLMISGRAKVKERRYEVMEALGISRELADRCEWVCTAIPAQYRARRPATFQHHVTVAGIKEHCLVHNAGFETGCNDCECARLDAIAFWLGKVVRAKGSMTVLELKTEIQEKYAPRDAAPKAKPKQERKKRKAEPGESVDLDEAEPEPEPEIWDPARLESAAKACRDQMQKNLKPRLANLVTKKGRPDRRRIEAAMNAAEDVRRAVRELIQAGGEALDSLGALAK